MKALQMLPPIMIPSSKPSRLRWLPLLLAVVLLIAWQAMSDGSKALFFQFSSPVAVLGKLMEWLGSGLLLQHLLYTFGEILGGFVVGVGVAFVLGYAIGKNRTVEAILNPYLIGFQAIPIVAIAPVLTLFFDSTLLVIVIISALIVFFPMLATTIVAIRNIHPQLRDLMRSLAANPWQTFLFLELPAALPTLFAGLKISVVLAVAGAVVGEAVRPAAGLGYLIYSSRYTFSAAGVIVAVMALAALSLSLYGLIARLERRLLRWQR